ncbi:hypothetical protein JT359_03970 [Candidatus Poribacteria bacterium]|nr:hypothetical protein [Candidatus Poribacteria bacterium]
MGIPFFLVFALSIVFLSLGITGWGDLVSIDWPEQESTNELNDDATVTPYISLNFSNHVALVQCCSGFVLFICSLYLMGFLLYLEERESGRIMKNVKSFAKLRQLIERYQKKRISERGNLSE